MTLIVVFIQWSTPIIYKFVDEEEAIEFQKRKGHTFPDITICPRQSYFDWLFKNFVCVATNDNSKFSLNDFYGTVKHCLDTEPEILDTLSSSAFTLENTTIRLESKNESVVIENSILKRVFHEVHGICFTLNANNWER